jgi:hypothetical protein
MKAKKKPVVKMTPDDLGIDLTPQFETLKVTEPPKRVGGGKVIYPHAFRYRWCLTLLKFVAVGRKCRRVGCKTQGSWNHRRLNFGTYILLEANNVKHIPSMPIPRCLNAANSFSNYKNGLFIKRNKSPKGDKNHAYTLSVNLLSVLFF